MYGKTLVAALIALAIAATPASAVISFSVSPLVVPTAGETVDYVAGNGAVVVFQDIEGTGSPGIGGARFVDAVATDSFEVVDLVAGELAEGADLDPLAFVVSCSDEGCNVFVGAGAVAGTITWTPAA